MKRRLLAVLLAVCLLSAMLPQMALFASVATYSGNCGTNGNNLTWSLNTGNGQLTISGNGAMKSYSTGMDTPWYAYRDSVKKVVVNSGATSIGNWAFAFCTESTSVTLPSSVTSIGTGALHYCISLPSITLPSGLKSISEDAFQSCFSLSSVAIPNGVTTIGKRAFANCLKLTRVTLPSTLTSIG